VAKTSKRYFNYVEYANKLSHMSHEELQAEMEFRHVALRMCEQELRARRHNQKIHNLAKQWKAEEIKDGTLQGAIRHSTVADK
jgi:hypothetical protein